MREDWCSAVFVDWVELEVSQDTLGFFQQWKATEIGPLEFRQLTFPPPPPPPLLPRLWQLDLGGEKALEGHTGSAALGLELSWGLGSSASDVSRSQLA